MHLSLLLLSFSELVCTVLVERIKITNGLNKSVHVQIIKFGFIIFTQSIILILKTAFVHFLYPQDEIRKK